MEQNETITLYTREGCHLCERVEVMLQELGAEWRPVDIEEDPNLEAEYGLRIPVLRLSDSGRELDFPFDHDVLRTFLSG